MTLSTDIYLTGSVDAHDVYNFCNQLMGSSNPKFTDGPCQYTSSGYWEIGNELGQGFPAILSVYYRPDGELATEDVWVQEDDNYRYLDIKACTVRISFDTGYFYEDEFGGCADLHARYIRALYLYAMQKGATLEWKNEYSGEYFKGTDGLKDFSHNGKEAGAWASEAVAAILANPDKLL